MPPSERGAGVSVQLAGPEYGLSNGEGDECLAMTFALRDVAVVVGPRRGTGTGSGLLGAGAGEPLREGHRADPEAGGDSLEPTPDSLFSATRTTSSRDSFGHGLGTMASFRPIPRGKSGQMSPTCTADPAGRLRWWGAIRRPGVVAVIAASVLFIMGHYVLYAYNSTFIVPIEDMQGGAFLLVFGLASLVSLWVAGMLVDRYLRRFMLVSLVAFGAALCTLGALSENTIVIYVAAAVWGLGFGGASGPAPQKALVDAAGDAVDAAQAVLVTGWNIGIALGGIIGGVALEIVGVPALPWAALVFILAAYIIVVVGRHNAFPARPASSMT